MRIAIVSPFVDRQHGTERAVAELIERLSTQYKDQIDLYAQRVSDIAVESSPAKRQTQTGGISFHRVPSLPGPHLLQFLGWLFLNRAARRPHKAGANPLDVVFSPGINALDADVVLVHAVFHRVAALQNSHRLGSLRLRHLHRKLYYLLLCRLERRVYSNPRVILAAVSRHTAVQLAEYFGRNDVNVIPNGVDADHFSIAAVASIREQSRQELRCSPQEFILVFIGNDWRNKGLKILFEAMAACKDLPIRLLIVGQDHQAGF